MHEILKGIAKRERITAKKLASLSGVGEASFRRMLRGELDMDVDIFKKALEAMGYEIIIMKKADKV